MSELIRGEPDAFQTLMETLGSPSRLRRLSRRRRGTAGARGLRRAAVGYAGGGAGESQAAGSRSEGVQHRKAGAPHVAAQPRGEEAERAGAGWDLLEAEGERGPR